MSAGEDENTDGETQTYPVGTLLDPDTQEPILTAGNERILIAEDEYAGESYLDANEGATIGEDLYVYSVDGERIDLKNNSENRLNQNGYTVVAEEGEVEIPDSVTDDNDDSEDSGPDIGESTGTVGESHQYGIEDYVPWAPTAEQQFEQGDGFSGFDVESVPDTMTIGDVTIPGVYEAEQHGEGKKSQYLNETQAGGGDDTNSSYQTNDGGTVDSSDSSDSSGGGEQVPPLTIEAQAYVGGATYEQLLEYHRTPATDETFSVALGDVTLDDCELVELTRSLSGENPTVYECSITVREYREYEVVDGSVQQAGGGGTPTGGETGGEFTSPVRQWTDQNNDGIDDETGEPLPEPREETGTSVSLGPGDALENVYIRNPGNISTQGDGWAIRNVAFDGANGSGWFMPQGNGIIENCYFDGPGVDEGGEGILVENEHPEGSTILIRFCHFRNWIDNAVYGSEPGNGSGHPTPGNRGRVIIEHCYAENNAISDYRIGSPGSFVRNCVSVNNQHRSMWVYYYDNSVINCDFDGDIVVGEDAWPTNAHLDIENTRIGGTVRTATGNDTYSGSVGSNPDLTPHENVPMSPEDAYQGRFYSPPPGPQQGTGTEQPTQ